MSEPQSLQEAIQFFSNPDNCIEYLAVLSLAGRGCHLPDLRVRQGQRVQSETAHLEVSQAITPSASSPSRLEL